MASNGKAVTGTAVMARSANEEKKKITLFSPRVSHSKHLPVFVLCCVLGLGFCCFVVFLFPVLQGFWNPEFSAQFRPR